MVTTGAMEVVEVEDVVVVKLSLIVKTKTNRVVITFGLMVIILATDLTLALTLLSITVVKLHTRIAWAVLFATRVGMILAANFLGWIDLHIIIVILL